MKELIAVTPHSTLTESVSARDLYLGLGLAKDQWSRWQLKNIVQNEFFTEGVDFVQLDIMSSATLSNPPVDFAISIEFAKHIALMARTEKSHEYRSYLISCEHKIPSLPNFSDEIAAAKAWIEAKESEKAALALVEIQKQTLQHKDDLIKASNEASIKAGEILIREFVKSVDIIDLGERQFFAWMRGQKIVFSDRNEPYQPYIKAGYFTYKPSEELINGKLRYTMRVTPRGKVWLAAKYMAYLDAASVAVLDGELQPRNGLVLLQGAQA